MAYRKINIANSHLSAKFDKIWLNTSMYLIGLCWKIINIKTCIHEVIEMWMGKMRILSKINFAWFFAFHSSVLFCFRKVSLDAIPLRPRWCKNRNRFSIEMNCIAYLYKCPNYLLHFNVNVMLNLFCQRCRRILLVPLPFFSE